MWEQFERLVTHNGVIVLTATQPFTSLLIASNLKMFKYNWIWRKSNCAGFLNAKKQPLRNYEDVCVFYRHQPVYNPQGVQAVHRVRYGKDKSNSTVYGKINSDNYIQTATGYPRQVFDIASTRQTSHPTEKPVKLMSYLIKTYTDEGMTVLDACMGSGTTGVAARQTGRHFVGIEMDEGYYQLASERIEKC